MATDEKRIQLAAKMYDTRDTMKRLYGGADFKKHMATFKPFVTAEMQARGGSQIEAAMRIIKDLQQNRPGTSEMAQAFILTAAVELIEPSEKSA